MHSHALGRVVTTAFAVLVALLGASTADAQSCPNALGVFSTSCTMTADFVGNTSVANNLITINCNNYKIWGSGSGTGISMTGKYGVVLKNCDVRGFQTNVYDLNGWGNVVRDSGMRNATAHGMTVKGTQYSDYLANGIYNNGWNGIQMEKYGTVNATDNWVLDSFLTGNVVDGADFNIGCHRTLFRGNTASYNGANGVEFDWCENVSVQYNWANENGFGAEIRSGISVDAATSPNVTYNHQANSNRRNGIRMVDGTNGTVNNNTACGNLGAGDSGICMVSGGSPDPSATVNVCFTGGVGHNVMITPCP